MILLALDPSLTRTGYAIFSAPPPKLDDLVTGSFHSADPEDFVQRLLRIVEDSGAEFLASEQARKVILMYGKKQLVGNNVFTPNADQLKLSEIQGGIRGICAVRGLPSAFVSPPTWRAAVLGNGGLSRAEAKSAAKTYCKRIGVTAANHDISEAICIGLWAATSCPAFRMAAQQQMRLGI